jgi:hypothetical protein
MPASDGSPRSECQPEPPVRLSLAVGRESGGEIGDRASIPEKMADNFLYCNSFATASGEFGIPILPISSIREKLTITNT